MKTKTITIHHEDGNEHDEIVPAKNAMCDVCDGDGTVLHPSIAQHCYSQEEFAEEFSDDEERAAYFTRGGMYDVACPCCKGAKVVVVVDEERASKREMRVIARWYRQQEESARNDRMMAAERRAEMGEW